MSNRPTIFLSYRRINEDLARVIYEYLKHRGAKIFFDREGMHTGDASETFPEQIKQQITRSDYFLLILSADTLQSDWVRRELKLARKLNKKIVPVLDGFEMTVNNLPADLRWLAEYHAVPYVRELANASLDKIAREVGLTQRSRLPVLVGTIALIAVVLVVGALLTTREGTSTLTLTATVTPSPTLVTDTPLPLPSPTLAAVVVTTAPTLEIVATFPPIPTSIPVVAPTVVIAQSKAYPCDATIVFTNGALLNQVRVLPQKNAIYRPAIQQGSAVVVLDKKKNDAVDWYQIRYVDSNTGWIPIEYVVPSSNCP